METELHFMKNRLSDCNIIFVDCFDTILLRKEHPFQVIRRWSNVVSRKFDKINPDELYQKRSEFSKEVNIAEKGIYAVR